MKKFFDWMARIVASVILIPAFYFKLSGAESSIATFTALDAEPFGRYVVGFFVVRRRIFIVNSTDELVRRYDCDGHYGRGDRFSYLYSRFSRRNGDFFFIGLCGSYLLSHRVGCK